MSRVLVTGAAGFIGSHVAERLLGSGQSVVGLDRLDGAIDVTLARARLDRLVHHSRFSFQQVDLADANGTRDVFRTGNFDGVVHLAAFTGVRASVAAPEATVRDNVTGFLEVLEGCRHCGVRHLVYASSSAVYGAGTPTPFAESSPADRPASLYAATKRSNELMAHAYSHLYGLSTTGLRFFTVYGPWGRPDMAVFLFSAAILENRPIDVFGQGTMMRDFTYIDDAVEAVVRVLDRPPAEPRARIYNVGSGCPVTLLELVHALESKLGRPATMRLLAASPADVPVTWADTSALLEDFGVSPSTPLDQGIERFVDWYRTSYGR